jgi:hypothetical protein
LSASEQHHRAGLKKAKLSFDFKVVICGNSAEFASSLVTIDKVLFEADRASEDIFGLSH